VEKKEFVSRYASSALRFRRIVRDVPLLQRADFINPARKSTIMDVKLSETAELKQQVSGSGMWTEVSSVLFI
jgi:hypothetical protein